MNNTAGNNEKTHRSVGEPSALVVLTVLAVTVLANAVEFPALERRATWISVLGRYCTPELTTLGRKHASISILSSPYLMIAEIAPEATIILPPRHPFDVDNLYGLARAQRVEVRSYPAAGLHNIAAIADAMIDDQYDERAGQPWTLSLAATQARPDTLVAIVQDGRWYLVEPDLLSQQVRQAAGF